MPKRTQMREYSGIYKVIRILLGKSGYLWGFYEAEDEECLFRVQRYLMKEEFSREPAAV